MEATQNQRAGQLRWTIVSEHPVRKKILLGVAAVLLGLFAWLGVLATYWLRRRCLESRSRDSRLERFASLPSHVYSEVSGADGDGLSGLPRLHNTECCICLEPFQPNSQVKILPCAHGFHDECIAPWMQSHDLCPVCRTSIRGDD